MNFKRIIVLVSSSLLLCLFLLAGCNGKSGGTTSEGSMGEDEHGIPTSGTSSEGSVGEDEHDIPTPGTIGSDPGKQLGLYLKDGTLMLGDKPFVGVGVNYYDGAFRIVANILADDIDGGIANLVEYGVPMVRIRFSPWGTEGMKLYEQNPELFFKQLDKCVRICEQNKIGIIADLAWTTTYFRDSENQSRVDFFTTFDGQGFQRMLKYFKEIIDRYKYSPAIWGWEIGNEYNLACNVSGEPLSPDHLGAFYDYVSSYIRQCDGSNRVIATGNSQNRGSSYHLWKENSWTSDTEAQEHEVMNCYMPENIDIHSIHVYNNYQMWDTKRVTLSKYIAENMEHCADMGRVLYIGEYCDNDLNNAPEDQKTDANINASFKKIHDAIVENKVPIAMIWRYTYELDCWDDLEEQSTFMLECAKDANTKYRNEGIQDTESYWSNVKNVMV